MDESLDIFDKVVHDITICGDKVCSEYKVIIFLNAISYIYKEVNNAIKYGRKTLIPDVVIVPLRVRKWK